jgi:hypothetical protein
MKNKIKTESGSSRIQKVEEKAQKAKVIKDLCNRIVWLFNMPANQGLDGSEVELSNLIDEIAPWQKWAGNDENFGRLYEAMKVSFGFGFALGQMLDLPEIDISPIKDVLRERKALLYMPHEKANPKSEPSGSEIEKDFAKHGYTLV